ncbi:hypothetical protein [Virgibacillus necropolis]|uniref:Uncharacterized protein n=1 Tax=Virgibacillus necropolis TaxID=163877 RepID=A0A221MEW0_9BACI|nr:hypothetical protein [Virgibacillus necropolis]ASN06208.1 hypothetical protein CFK40_14840 [Virgibacillus necropolis]
MDQKDKLKAFEELFDLLVFFSENRDMPVDKDFNFFGKVEYYCKQLDLDYNEFIEVYQLKTIF